MYQNVGDCTDDIDIRRCEKLSESIRHYFTDPSALDNVLIKVTYLVEFSLIILISYLCTTKLSNELAYVFLEAEQKIKSTSNFIA